MEAVFLARPVPSPSLSRQTARHVSRTARTQWTVGVDVRPNRWKVVKSRTAHQGSSPTPSTAASDSGDVPSSTQLVLALRPAADLVEEFYGHINRKDPEAALELIADDCVYEDLTFPEPFVGKEATLGLFKKFTDGMGSDFAFVIDDISRGDPDAVGVIWHLAWKGKEFPSSKGCSFYRCQVIGGERKIKFFRDVVESPLKPGDAALVAIKGVTFLLERFPQIADAL